MFKVDQVLLTETTSGAAKQEDVTISEGTAALPWWGWGRQPGAAVGRLRKDMSSTLFNLHLLLIFELKSTKQTHTRHCMSSIFKYIYLFSLLASDSRKSRRENISFPSFFIHALDHKIFWEHRPFGLALKKSLCSRLCRDLKAMLQYK